MCALLASVEKITHVVRRGQVYETLLSREKKALGAAIENLQSSLIQLYMSAWELLADSTSLFSTNTAMRFMNTLVHPDQSTGALSQLEKLETALQHDAQVFGLVRGDHLDKRLRRLVEGLAAPLYRVDDGIAILLDQLGESEHEKILNWLSTVPYGKHHRAVRELRTKDTCHWLLEQDQFRTWESVHSVSLLWLQGARELLSF
jgi:hypothetical protein